MIIRKKNIGFNSILFLLLLFTFENFAFSKTLEDENLDLLEKVINLVDKEYIDSTNQNELMESAINGMLQSLDPHSVYLPPKEFENLQNNTSGQFGGLGIEVGGIIFQIANRKYFFMCRVSADGRPWGCSFIHLLFINTLFIGVLFQSR